MNRYGTSAPYRIMQAVGVLLVVAVVGRLAWSLLQPLIPVLILLVGLSVVYGIVLRGRR